MASLSELPPEMLSRMSMSMLDMRGFFWPEARMSKLCTIGTPDCSMVAIWRLNTAISLGETALPAAPNSGLDLVRTTVGLMPCLRSSALSRLAFLDWFSPFILTPRLSVPSQMKFCISEVRVWGAFALTAVVAMV